MSIVMANNVRRKHMKGTEGAEPIQNEYVVAQMGTRTFTILMKTGADRPFMPIENYPNYNAALSALSRLSKLP